jgi:hypothetical protein
VRARQVVGQVGELVAGEVEDLQRVSESEDFLGKLGEAGAQVEALEAVELAGAQLGKGVHGRKGRGRADF